MIFWIIFGIALILTFLAFVVDIRRIHECDECGADIISPGSVGFVECEQCGHEYFFDHEDTFHDMSTRPER